VTLGAFQYLDTLDFKSNFPISLVKNGDTWRLPSLIPSENSAEVYFPLEGPKQTSDKLRAEDLEQHRLPPVTVEIEGTRIPLGIKRLTVYDPQDRWLIFLRNLKFDCWNLR
jgi:hypothetical protein